ncbi:MAG: hypothetical protein M1834_009723 [Cirrosporium novae-zelandiae]|nr:MAG: hypothetical protein M1834_009723 [Cirrosporium novae-zelandiae]
MGKHFKSLKKFREMVLVKTIQRGFAKVPPQVDRIKRITGRSKSEVGFRELQLPMVSTLADDIEESGVRLTDETEDSGIRLVDTTDDIAHNLSPATEATIHDLSHIDSETIQPSLEETHSENASSQDSTPAGTFVPTPSTESKTEVASSIDRPKLTTLQRPHSAPVPMFEILSLAPVTRSTETSYQHELAILKEELAEVVEEAERDRTNFEVRRANLVNRFNNAVENCRLQKLLVGDLRSQLERAQAKHKEQNLAHEGQHRNQEDVARKLQSQLDSAITNIQELQSQLEAAYSQHHIQDMAMQELKTKLSEGDLRARYLEDRARACEDSAARAWEKVHSLEDDILMFEIKEEQARKEVVTLQGQLTAVNKQYRDRIHAKDSTEQKFALLRKESELKTSSLQSTINMQKMAIQESYNREKASNDDVKKLTSYLAKRFTKDALVLELRQHIASQTRTTSKLLNLCKDQVKELERLEAELLKERTHNAKAETLAQENSTELSDLSKKLVMAEKKSSHLQQRDSDFTKMLDVMEKLRDNHSLTLKQKSEIQELLDHHQQTKLEQQLSAERTARGKERSLADDCIAGPSDAEYTSQDNILGDSLPPIVMTVRPVQNMKHRPDSAIFLPSEDDTSSCEDHEPGPSSLVVDDTGLKNSLRKKLSTSAPTIS